MFKIHINSITKYLHLLGYENLSFKLQINTLCYFIPK